MQANKDQDWTDDAAFWDDAWADMNTRLDEKPDRPKGAMAWWPFYFAIAGVFVLATVMGSGIIFDQGEAETIMPVPSVQEPVPAGQDPVVERKAVIAAASTGADAPVEEQVLTPVETDIRQQLDQSLTTVATAQLAVTALPDEGAAQRGLTPLPEVTTAQRGLTPPPTEVTALRSFTPPMNILSPASPTKNDASEEKTTEVVKANISWGTSCGNIFPGIATDLLKQKFIAEGILPLEIDQLFVGELNSLPTVPFQPHRYPNPLTLEAAFTSDFSPGHPGGLVGIGYRITGGKKLSFPLSLRYRFDQLEVSDSPLEEADAVDISTGDPTVENSDLVLVPRSLSITSVEVAAGLAWDATPRFRLSTGLGASYQLQALVNFEGQSSRSIFNQFGLSASEDFSLLLDRGEALLSTLTIDGSSPNVNPWTFRAHLGAAYDITPRLGVSLKATRLLTQPDRAGVIGLRAGRLELGLSYRLR